MTVTETPILVVWLALFRAVAVRVWAELLAALVSHENEKGAAVTSAPRFAVSSLYCTATAFEVFTVINTVPETVAPEVGALITTVGSSGAELLTVTETPALVVLFPAASRATAVRTWVPLLALAVFHVVE